MTLSVDEELWFATDPDPSAEKAAAESMAARVARIVGAKTFPIAAKRLEQITRDPNCPIHEVVRVLETDPALSARLLRLVNSAGFGLRVRCSAVRHAAALVGLDKLHQLATTAAVLDMFDSGSKEASQVVEHGNVVAALSRYLAGHLALDGDDLFTCGFLHDIGKLMLLETEGKEYARLVRKHGREPDAMHRAEQEAYGFDHAMLGAHVLSEWSIPSPIPKVVAWHHRVGLAYQASTSIAMMVNTVRLADAISYAVSRPDAEESIARIARTDAASYLDISEQQLAAMWDELSTLYRRTRAVFRGDEPPESAKVSARPRQTLRPSLGTAMQLDEDADEPASSEEPEEFEAPRQYPCVICRKPSFGNPCGACSGYVCPEHEVGRDGLCQLCSQELEDELGDDRLPLTTQIALGVGMAGLGVAGYLTAMVMPTEGTAKLYLTPAIVLALAAMTFFVVRRASFRARFRRTRPSREAPPVDSPFGSMYRQPHIQIINTEPSGSTASTLRAVPHPRSTARDGSDVGEAVMTSPAIPPPPETPHIEGAEAAQASRRLDTDTKPFGIEPEAPRDASEIDTVDETRPPSPSVTVAPIVEVSHAEEAPADSEEPGRVEEPAPEEKPTAVDEPAPAAEPSSGVVRTVAPPPPGPRTAPVHRCAPSCSTPVSASSSVPRCSNERHVATEQPSIGYHDASSEGLAAVSS